MIALALLLGCPSGPAPDTDVPTPVDTAPPPDTGLPTPPPPPEPAVEVRVGPLVPCPDIGRDTKFYDRIAIGEAPPDAPRGWKAAGFAIDDFDADGALEIFAPGLAAPQMWDHTQGTWTDRAAQLGQLDLSDAVGAAAADFDGDGDPDVLVTRYGKRNVLLRNDGGQLVDVSDAAGIPDTPTHTASAAWGDFDGDGWLDLFVGNYGPVPEDAWDPDMAPGEPSELLKNNGDGTFTDASAMLPDSVHDGYTFQAGFFDVEADGFPELFVLQDFGWVRPSIVLWNRQGAFEADDGTASFHPNFAGMGLAVGDLNGDRIPDFAQSSYEDVSLLVSQQTPFATQGVAWVEFAEAMGMTLDLQSRNQFFGWGTDFGDLDSDGDLDLAMGFGKWDEYSNPNWQYDTVWVQTDGQLQQRGASTTWDVDDRGATRGLLLVDLDDDGWLDIVKRVLDAPITAHMSRCTPTRHWSKVVLEDPTTPNHRAIGARVTLFAGPLVMTRWVHAGSASMFSSARPDLHFGLNEELVVERIEITWPDGTTDVVTGDLPADRVLRLVRRPTP
ncbi:MAG: CRTAC1 family protein [Alphaproteobacteria bacterium]|nr:CRTAC1 family protein [Alphaproteobacteria bacterium]